MTTPTGNTITRYVTPTGGFIEVMHRYNGTTSIMFGEVARRYKCHTRYVQEFERGQEMKAEAFLIALLKLSAAVLIGETFEPVGDE